MGSIVPRQVRPLKPNKPVKLADYHHGWVMYDLKYKWGVRLKIPDEIVYLRPFGPDDPRVVFILEQSQ